MQKPLDFCVQFNKKVNQAIIDTILESAFELYNYGLSNDTFKWDNSMNNACTLFDIDFYNNRVGDLLPLKTMTNIVITIKNEELVDDLQFHVIDIFNDCINLCIDVNGDVILSIPLTKFTEVDEGYIFQMETESPIMPFTVQNLKLIQKHATLLGDEYHD